MLAQNTSSPQPVTAYPDSPEGLQHYIDDLRSAFQVNGTAKVASRQNEVERPDTKIGALSSKLLIPNHASWFIQVFGAEMGLSLEVEYDSAMNSPQGAFAMFEAFHNDKSTYHAERLEEIVLAKPTLEAMKKPTSGYVVLLNTGRLFGSFYFFYSEGSFYPIPSRLFTAFRRLPPGKGLHEAVQEALKNRSSLPAPAGGGGQGIDGGNVELLTPTQGVDFTNYLARVAAMVKRNWYALMPQSARLGERGKAILQFLIMKDGVVPEAEPVLASSSGKAQLDLAASSSVRASAPFEPLPSAFNKPFIELRFTFLYNMPLNESSPKAEPISKVNSRDGLTYVWIPPGTFQMGCSPGDSECQSVEKPAHSVTLNKGFWIGQTPVTQAAYQKIAVFNPSNFNGIQLPVENVNWGDAKAYCESVDLRLPTEAEWEYAARGGMLAAQYAPVDQIAWYGANSGGTTHEVMQKQANGFGLYDMLGNVGEWVADWYEPFGAVGAVDPNGPPSGQFRVLRGSWWGISDSSGIRVSTRYMGIPDRRTALVGFRCAGD